MSRKEFYIGIMAVVAIAFSRMIPHPPNFTPVISMAAFGGLYFDRSWKSLLLPLTAMMLSDLFIGVHTLLPFLYLIFAIICLAPRLLNIRPSISNYLQLSFLRFPVVAPVLFAFFQLRLRPEVFPALFSEMFYRSN